MQVYKVISDLLEPVRIVESSTFIVFHSLSSEEPVCTSGSKLSKEYSGYSFTFAHGYGFSLSKTESSSSNNCWILFTIRPGQSLGDRSSCMRSFNRRPFIACTGKFCDSNMRSGYRQIDHAYVCVYLHFLVLHSYWLSSDDISTSAPADVSAANISRCTVCSGAGIVAVEHSFTTKIPDCPDDQYVSLWVGYSFAGVRLSMTPFYV